MRAGGRPPDEARGEYWMRGAAPGSHVPSKCDEVQKQAWCNNCTVPGVPATCGVVSNSQPIQMVSHLAEFCPVLNRKNPDGSTNSKKTYWMGEMAARKAATAASSAMLEWMLCLDSSLIAVRDHYARFDLSIEERDVTLKAMNGIQ